VKKTFGTAKKLSDKSVYFLISLEHLSIISFTAQRAATLKSATVARQPCYHIPLYTGFRPVALRPTLSSGLPLSSFLNEYDNFCPNWIAN
jgi:hypothetical protein